MGIEGESPSAEEIAFMRTKVQEYIDANGSEVFDERDLTRWKLEDKYVSRFFMHMYDFPGVQHEVAANMAINAFKWRKDNNINDLRDSDLSARLKESGDLYIHGTDKDGKKLLVFAVRKHVKGVDSSEDLRKFFHYLLERIDKETKGDQLTLIFDCNGCGLKNMDMELIQYMIHVFKEYYPWSLNYILVYEMPWVLNAAWKVIKSWLPAAAVKRIKFLTKSNVGEYLHDAQRPVAWGGTDEWEYQWQDEEMVDIPFNQHNGDLIIHEDDLNRSHDDLTNRKKCVSFAEMKSSSNPNLAPASPLKNQSVTDIFPQPFGSSLLSIQPAEEIVFVKTASGDLVAKIQMKNISSKVIVYKIKTTSPDKYRVRPSMSSLVPGAMAGIEINVHGSHLANINGCSTGQILASLVKDKFLITATTASQDVNDPLSNAQISDLLKTARPEAQFRLRCTVQSNDLPPSLGGLLTHEDKLGKQLDLVTRKLNTLAEAHDNLQASLNSIKMMMFFMLVLLALLVGLMTQTWLPTHSNLEANNTLAMDKNDL